MFVNIQDQTQEPHVEADPLDDLEVDHRPAGLNIQQDMSPANLEGKPKSDRGSSKRHGSQKSSKRISKVNSHAG